MPEEGEEPWATAGVPALGDEVRALGAVLAGEELPVLNGGIPAIAPE